VSGVRVVCDNRLRSKAKGCIEERCRYIETIEGAFGHLASQESEVEDVIRSLFSGQIREPLPDGDATSDVQSAVDTKAGAA
jgi:hypothetical protein